MATGRWEDQETDRDKCIWRDHQATVLGSFVSNANDKVLEDGCDADLFLG